MSVNVDVLNAGNTAISKKRVFGRLSPRFENGRVMDIEAKLVFRTDEEMVKFTEFVNSLKDKDI